MFLTLSPTVQQLDSLTVQQLQCLQLVSTTSTYNTVKEVTRQYSVLSFQVCLSAARRAPAVSSSPAEFKESCVLSASPSRVALEKANRESCFAGEQVLNDRLQHGTWAAGTYEADEQGKRAVALHIDDSRL